MPQMKRVPQHETGKTFPTRADANKGRPFQPGTKSGAGIPTHSFGKKFGTPMASPTPGYTPVQRSGSGVPQHDKGHRFGKTSWTDKSPQYNPKGS